MCNCNNETCPNCDPGIEGFYQQKVKEAKEAVDYLKTIGVEMSYHDLLDAKDIWYEYCALSAAEQVDDEANSNIPPEIYELDHSWKL